MPATCLQFYEVSAKCALTRASTVRARSLARSRDIFNLYEALNPCRARRAGLLIRYLPGRLWLARGRFDFIIVARGISRQCERENVIINNARNNHAGIAITTGRGLKKGTKGRRELLSNNSNKYPSHRGYPRESESPSMRKLRNTRDNRR